ncbi:MAG: sigma-54-dependent Fis family transcriptional regulator [Candidatus Omnitrophica bacterium]|nr:sigma-54-dependent Fis family transcriptional regulator [Candidatus Omnitrophota bacterium]
MANKARILVVDDEPVVCRNCSKILTESGHEVETLQSSRLALERIKEELFDAVIVDLKMPGLDGMELLRLIKEINPEIIVIMITGYSAVESAVEAMRLGAFDYIPKPFTPDEFSIRIEKALEKRSLVQENRYLRQELKEKYKFDNIIGKSKKMQVIYQIIEKVAPTDSAVLIHGESGSGKELIARAIHYNSLRKEKPFMSLDCGALTESLLESELFGHVKGSFTGATVTKPGLFEVANGGTFFLDEIGDISLSIQAKLLRVLQEREIKPVGATRITKVDIRLITATNKNLEEMIKKGTFREDLFYRLNVVPIYLPPLQDRVGDIPLLVTYFLEKYNRERKKDIKGFSQEAMKLLEEYDWPGNVRELENVIERIVVMTNENEEVIKPEHLPLNVSKNKINTMMNIPKNSEELKKLKKQVRKEAIKNIERLFIIEALTRNKWNITKAANDVGMKRQNFQTLIKKYQISPSNPA